ncbi:hypothetical protein HAX54_024263 [Datura stramonium]|uniref:Uncharacterized protein n=1 Tax=Datura stramonium TaxID=4076 RepID=A0ABS8S7K8_DATST|nr:hypothetical protein [Datura stramonium]
MRHDFDRVEDDTSFPHEDLEVMQETLRSTPDDPLLPRDEVEVMQDMNRRSQTGSLVRDRNIYPLRVHSWADIEEDKLDHMWGAVTEIFNIDDMNDHRDHVLNHMRRLWNNWRGSLHKNAKAKLLQGVLKVVPRGIDKSD